MITLSNGDKWILGSSEWEDKDISYEEACKCNIPTTPIEDFIKAVCNYYTDDDDDFSISPEKWTPKYNGYWDANFNVFEEVFSDVAVSEIDNPWSNVYEMPWGDVIVVFQIPDCGGYDCQYMVAIYKNRQEYMEQVTFKEGGN